MVNDIEYNFSFTAGSALIQETITVANVLIDKGFDWNKTKCAIIEGNLLQKDKSETSMRQFSLIKSRLERLTNEQINRLCTDLMPEKRILILLAIIKAHSLIFDFIVDSVRTKYFAFDYKLKYADYNAFIQEKLEEHQELTTITETTDKKIRQIVFKILEQTELIDSVKEGNIKNRIYHKR